MVTDFKLRYQDSLLGYAWSILKPLFLFLILYIVFEKFLRLGRDIENFPIYLLLGIVLWNFFAEATQQGLQSIVSRGDLLRKINFPKYIIVISGTISSLINLVLNLVVVGIFMIFSDVSLSWQALLVIPLIVELYVFALGIAFFLSALNVRFRDTGYIWEIFMQALFYATPVIYPLQMVYKQWPEAAGLLLFNPVSQIIQDIRFVVVTPQAITIWQLQSGLLLLVPFLIIAVTVVVASTYFRKSSKYFAENI